MYKVRWAYREQRGSSLRHSDTAWTPRQSHYFSQDTAHSGHYLLTTCTSQPHNLNTVYARTIFEPNTCTGNIHSVCAVV